MNYSKIVAEKTAPKDEVPITDEVEKQDTLAPAKTIRRKPKTTGNYAKQTGCSYRRMNSKKAALDIPRIAKDFLNRRRAGAFTTRDRIKANLLGSEPYPTSPREMSKMVGFKKFDGIEHKNADLKQGYEEVSVLQMIAFVLKNLYD